MKKLVLILAFILTMLVTPVMAADVMDIGTSARSIGLGRSYIGITDVGECVFGNPAGLKGLKKPELVSMYTELGGDVKYTLIGIAIPAQFGTLGMGYASNRVWDIFSTTRDATGRLVTGEPFSYGTDMILVDYSNKVDNRLSYGLRLKYLDKGGSTAVVGRGTGMNVDLGLSYAINEDSTLGMVAENLIAGGAGSIKWNNGIEEEMPFVLNIGGRYGFNNINTDLYTDISLGKKKPPEIRLGGEWKGWRPLTLRAGLEQLNPGPSESYINYSLGAGLDLGAFRVDYAYYNDSLVQYNSRHYISFVISPFGESAEIKEGGEILEPGYTKNLLDIFEKNLNEAFGPDNTVRRDKFAKAVEKTFLKKEPDEKSVKSNPFIDVPVDNWAAPYIFLAKEKKHMSGFPEGTFRPSNKVTRAEYASVMETVFSKDGKVTGKEKYVFPDVPVGHWAEKAVTAARERRHLSGYPDGLFRPVMEIIKMDAMWIIKRMKK